MNRQNSSVKDVRWGIRAVIALLFITVAIAMSGVNAQAALTKQDAGMSSKKMYRLYSNLIKKKKLKYYNKNADQPVDVYVHDVNQDGIPEVIVGNYVFTIYNGKAVKAGCGAKIKGAFCKWSFNDTDKQVGVLNSIDYLAAYELSEGKLVMSSSCVYGMGEQEEKWNKYAEWFRSRFTNNQHKACKTMDAVLKYIKKKL
jgi:hypothetical protein